MCLASHGSSEVAIETMKLTCGLALLLLSVAAAQEDTGASQRPDKYKKWRQENPPKVCRENPPKVCTITSSLRPKLVIAQVCT